MAVRVEEKHMISKEKDVSSEDETELLTSLLKLAREGHFSFVYNEITSTEEKAQPHQNNEDNDISKLSESSKDNSGDCLPDKCSVRECKVADDKVQTPPNMESNDNNKLSIPSKHNLENCLNNQHSIGKCIIKLQRLSPELLAKSGDRKALKRNCFINICKLPLIEKQLLLSKSSLSQRSIEIGSNISKVHKKYYLTKGEYWKCKLCKIKTKDKSNIIQHVYGHLLLALCRCKICSKQFRIKYNIK